MNFYKPKVKIESLNVLDPDTYCPKARLTIEMDFTFPGQEDGHGPLISRENDIAEIILEKLKHAQSQIEEELKHI